MRTIVAAFAVIVVGAVSTSAQDSITVGSASAARGSSVEIPVYVRDVSATTLGQDKALGNRIRGVAMKVVYSPASAVSSISFARGGVLTGTPLYEQSVSSSGALGYIVSFPPSTELPFTMDAAAPGNQAGTLSIGISATATAGSSVTLTIDAATATLSNASGTVLETTNTGLALTNGSVTVTPAATTTTLISSANSSMLGQSVTFTATVSSAVAGTPTGNVNFKEGATTLATVALSSGQGSHTSSALSAGSHSITAEYTGDTSYSASTSSVLTQTVMTAFGAPTGVAATATSPNNVLVSWNPVSNADHYDVYRRAGGGMYMPVGSTPAMAFNDGSVLSGQTYLYYVRAVTAGGAMSDNSLIDPATTITFADDPLSAGTIVKAVHVSELRGAVNAFRAAVGLGGLTFSDSSLVGATIRATHVQELRDALATVRMSAGVPPAVYSDSPLTSGVLIKAAHVRELRSALK